MKKFYYYSNSKIHTVDVKDFYIRYRGFLLSLACGLGVSVILFGYSLIANNGNSNSDQEFLSGRFRELAARYKDLESELSSLRNSTSSLRTAVNLPQISADAAQTGTGGSLPGSLSELMTQKGNIGSVLHDVEAIIRKFEFEKRNLREIQTAFEKNQRLYSSLPAIKPCSGEVSKDGFGMRYHPILRFTRMHEGIDITTDVGTEVVSTADGIVQFVGLRNGYGTAVVVEHGNGYTTLYGHLSQTIVREGQKVKRGQRIALSGNSGLSTGPHLHYEVWQNGTKLNPENFFFDSDQLFVTERPYEEKNIR